MQVKLSPFTEIVLCSDGNCSYPNTELCCIGDDCQCNSCYTTMAMETLSCFKWAEGHTFSPFGDCLGCSDSLCHFSSLTETEVTETVDI